MPLSLWRLCMSVLQRADWCRVGDVEMEWGHYVGTVGASRCRERKRELSEQESRSFSCCLHFLLGGWFPGTSRSFAAWSAR